MQNNVFQFRDTYWLQLIGTPPAPAYTNLTFALHKNTIIKKSAPNLIMYKRYIKDIYDIWVHLGTHEEDERLYYEFKKPINGYDELNWIFIELISSLDYLDIVITIIIHNYQIWTTLQKKELNLYLYISPHSACPPGV